MKKREITIPLVLILLGGFAFRLVRLGRQSLWYDETVSAVLAQKSIPELIAHTARDIHPPGYYLLLHFWAQAAGSSEFALAFFSLACGLLLVAVIFRLGTMLHSRQTGLWSAALVAFSPYNLWYSQEVRMYTLGALLGALAVYFTLRGLTRTSLPIARWNRILPWAAYAVVSAAGLYTLYYFAFLLIALNLFLLVDFALIQDRRQHFRDWLAANIAIIVLYLPWISIAWKQATDPPVPPWRSYYPWWRIGLETWSALTLGESVEPGRLWPLLLIAPALFVAGVIALGSSRKRILLPLLAFGPVAIMGTVPLITGSPLYHVRYIFTYSPPFYLVIGAGLARLWPKQRLATGIALLGLVIGAGYSTIQFHTNPRYAADDLRGAVRFIQDRWRPGDVILVNAGYTYTAFRYYLDHPVDNYQRLTSFNPETSQTDPYLPLILQAGTVDGPESLGWGDPLADFYAMSTAETEAALDRVSRHYPRIWMLRAYDTVPDPTGVIRWWLAANTIPFEDRAVDGPSYFRVEGFLTGYVPQPPQQVDFSFEGRFRLQGITPPGLQYAPGQAVHVALWLQPLVDVSGEPPYAVSLKLWDEAGNLAAETDEWPAGSLYFSPKWQTDRPLRHPMRLILPNDLTPGRYWLDLQMYRTDTGLPVTVVETSQNGVTLGDFEVVSESVAPPLD